MNPRHIVLLGTIVLVVVLAALARSGDPADPAPTATAVPHFGTNAIEVRITDEAVVSRGQSPVLVQLETGTIPSDVTQLSVLTDENCQPDAEGVSHCLNRVMYSTSAGSGEAVLRHHHRMSEEPCLAPGQTLQLVS
jgi:hypothetical protein